MAAENHIIDYEGKVQELTEAFKTHVNVMGKVVEKYKEWQLPKLPSEYINQLNQVNTANEKIVLSNQKVIESSKKVKEAKKSEVQQVLNTGSSIAKQKEKEIELANKQAFEEEKAALASIKSRNKVVQNTLNTGSSLAKQKEREITALEKEVQQLEKANNFYNRVQQRVNELTASYNDLALKKELGMKLTAEEEIHLRKMITTLNGYTQGLKKVDAQAGKFTRNVGNYASGFNPLNNAVGQIARELPNAGMSFQIFAMSLTNNIGALQDAIVGLQEKNKALIADGKATQSVFKQVAAAFLSWNTVLYLGIAIFTAYSKEIGEFFKEMFKGSKSIDIAKESLAAYNEALKSGDYEGAYTKVAKVNIAFRQAREGVISKEEALKTYNKELGDTMGITNDFTKAEKTFIEQARNYVEATMIKAQADILLSKAKDLSIKNLELQTRKEATLGETLKSVWGTGGVFGRIWRDFKGESPGQAVIDNIESQRKTAQDRNSKEAQGFLSEAEKLMEDFYKLTEKLNFGSQKTENKTNTKNDAETNRKKELEEQYRLQVSIIEQMQDGQNKELDLLNAWYEYQQELHKNNATELLITNIDYWTKLSALNKKYRDLENDEFIKSNDEKEAEYNKWETEYLKGIEEFEKTKQYWRDWETEKILKSEEEKTEMYLKTQENLKSILATSFDGLGFGSLSFAFDDQLKNMWENTESTTGKMAIAFQVFGQIANDVFAKLKASSDAYYDNQYNQLEKEKETALKYAGENTAGREAIEEQYNARRLQLKRQQAKQEKEMAIFQAMINIATGVTSALAQAPPYSFILAALVGALGAVQIASIASQPLPAFWKGTNNAPEGWAIVDELRPEVHTDKHGNVKSMGSTGGANMRYLERGDKIFKSHSDFFREMSPSYVDQFGGLHIENNGLSKADLEDVMVRTVGKQSNQQTVIDENGFNNFVINGQSRTRIRNRRSKFNK